MYWKRKTPKTNGRFCLELLYQFTNTMNYGLQINVCFIFEKIAWYHLVMWNILLMINAGFWFEPKPLTHHGVAPSRYTKKLRPSLFFHVSFENKLFGCSRLKQNHLVPQKDCNLLHAPRKCYARVIRAAWKSGDAPFQNSQQWLSPLLLIKSFLTVQTWLFLKLVFQN